MISEIDIRDWGEYPTKPVESKEQYEHYLRKFDWSYEFSDDHRVFMQGIRGLSYLSEAMVRFDPGGELFSQYKK